MNKPRLTVKNGQVVGFRSQAYEGATHGRRAQGWTAPSVGPNRALNGALNTLRNRARQSYRNNAWIRQAIDRNVSNEIGTGIVPMFESPDTGTNTRLADLWLPWTGQSCADGSLDFYGQLAQAARCRRTAGECFIRVRYRPFSWGLTVPIQLQVIEPDHVPLTLNDTLANGNRIVAGKEYTPRGRWVAVYMHPEHPQDQTAAVDINALIRVPASQVIHHYLPLRPGQVRGEPDIVPALLRAYTYDNYEDFELKRKESRAPLTGVIQKDYNGDEDEWKFDPLTGDPRTDSSVVPEINAQPGTFIAGLMGEKITLFDGDSTGQGYSDFQKQQLLAIAAGAKSLRELMTGDWSGVNDRTYRAMIQEYRREIEMAQDHLVIHQVCERVGFWFTDQCVALGLLPAPDYAARYDEYNKRDWRPHRWPHIHPTQDVNATIKEIEHDLESHDAAVAKRGYQAALVQQKNVDSRKRKRDMEREAQLIKSEETTA